MLYIFLTTPHEGEKYVQSNSSDNCIHRYNVEILNLFDSELQLINTKLMIKNIQEAHTILVSDYKKRHDCKIFHSSDSDSDIDEALKFMHQSIMTKTKKYACKDWIVLDVIIKHSIMIFDC